MLFGWGDAALRNLRCGRAFASAQEQGAANGLQGCILGGLWIVAARNWRM